MTSIEESIFKSLLYNEEFARKVYPYLEDEFFDGHHKTLFRSYKDLFDKYNKIPSFEAIGISLQKQSIGESEFEDIFNFMEDIYKHRNELPDTDWLVDETEAYCQDKKIYNAVYQSINILEGNDKKFDKHIIPDLLDDALAVSFDQSIGMEFFEGAEKRFDRYQDEDTRLKFPLKALNLLSNGGLKKKTLSAILAGPNVGKSAMMCYLAGEFLKQGKNVLYISMEMAEEDLMQRVEANLLDVSTDDLETMGKDAYMSKIEKVKHKTHGKFFAKEYPTSSAHAGHFRHLLKELKQKKKFTPDVVFIDYINICASSRYKSLSGVNSYSYIKAIAEELRGLAVEFEIPIMTATQVNRDGMNDSSPDMTSTSESFGLPATLDWFIAATQDEVLAEAGQQLWHLLKTRWGKKADIKPQRLNIDWDKMRYSDIDETSEVQSATGKNPDPTKRPNHKKKGRSLEDIDWG